MSAFTEFICLAIALYLWESTLWLPLRGIALRRGWKGKKWQILDPRGLFAAREIGLIAMRPWPSDSGLAPCQAPPLLTDGNDGFLMEIAPDVVSRLATIEWSDLQEEPHHLVIRGKKIRVSSARVVDDLRRAKQRGATPEEAVRRAWRRAFSATHAAREWKRWRLVSRQLRFNGPVLAVGFFAGLPLAYIYLGTPQMLLLAGWLWGVMAWTAARLWWLGKRVYPGARSALRMDALLSLLVPFHAMRAMEIASVHAMATTHPVGLVLSTRNLENPWLAHFIRKTLYPMPDAKGDTEFQAALRPFLDQALANCGKEAVDYDHPPDRSNDNQAEKFCPRCHALYLAKVETCPDCHGVILRNFAINP